MKKAWAIWVVAICFTACFDLPQEVEEALELAGKNRWELKRVLKHYRQDSLKFRAACFLIENMRWHYSDTSGYKLYSEAKDSELCDLQRLDGDFLIPHIDHAFEQWERSPYACRLTFEEFCEYVLPYRNLAGYPTCFSGKELYEQLGKYVGADKGDLLDSCVGRYNRMRTDFCGSLDMSRSKTVHCINNFSLIRSVRRLRFTVAMCFARAVCR